MDGIRLADSVLRGYRGARAIAMWICGGEMDGGMEVEGEGRVRRSFSKQDKRAVFYKSARKIEEDLGLERVD